MQLVEDKFGSEENEEGLQSELVVVEGSLGWIGDSEESILAGIEFERAVKAYAMLEAAEEALRRSFYGQSDEEIEARGKEREFLQTLQLYLGSNYHLHLGLFDVEEGETALGDA